MAERAPQLVWKPNPRWLRAVVPLGGLKMTPRDEVVCPGQDLSFVCSDIRLVQSRLRVRELTFRGDGYSSFMANAQS